MITAVKVQRPCYACKFVHRAAHMEKKLNCYKV